MGLSVLRPSLSLIPSPLRSRPRSFPVYGRRPAVAVGICKIALPEASPSPAAGGAEEALFEFVAGKRKATEVAHLVWKNVLRKGDCAIDATCGNGHDTLALLRMVADDSGSGFIYGFDIQSSALENTRSLLEASVDPDQRRLVRLSLVCHSKMEDVLPEGTIVRLVAFNLGYLPGGDKGIITVAGTTRPALEAASRVVASGGLISVLVYVGHPGGREELETVQSFASSLPAESWSCCKLERLNRPSAPVLVLLFKK